MATRARRPALLDLPAAVGVGVFGGVSRGAVVLHGQGPVHPPPAPEQAVMTHALEVTASGWDACATPLGWATVTFTATVSAGAALVSAATVRGEAALPGAAGSMVWSGPVRAGETLELSAQAVTSAGVESSYAAQAVVAVADPDQPELAYAAADMQPVGSFLPDPTHGRFWRVPGIDYSNPLYNPTTAAWALAQPLYPHDPWPWDPLVQGAGNAGFVVLAMANRGSVPGPRAWAYGDPWMGIGDGNAATRGRVRYVKVSGVPMLTEDVAASSIPAQTQRAVYTVPWQPEAWLVTAGRIRLRLPLAVPAGDEWGYDTRLWLRVGSWDVWDTAVVDFSYSYFADEVLQPVTPAHIAADVAESWGFDLVSAAVEDGHLVVELELLQELELPPGDVLRVDLAWTDPPPPEIGTPGLLCGAFAVEEVAP
jgi:hypothetical protein